MLEVAKDKLESKYQARVRFLARRSTQDLVLEGDERPDVITAMLCHHYLQKDAQAGGNPEML